MDEDNETSEDEARQTAREAMPPVEDMLLVQDFESWAERVLTNVAWAYYCSAADHEACRSRLLTSATVRRNTINRV